MFGGEHVADAVVLCHAGVDGSEQIGGIAFDIAHPVVVEVVDDEEPRVGRFELGGEIIEEGGAVGVVENLGAGGVEQGPEDAGHGRGVHLIAEAEQSRADLAEIVASVTALAQVGGEGDEGEVEAVGEGAQGSEQGLFGAAPGQEGGEHEYGGLGASGGR